MIQRLKLWTAPVGWRLLAATIRIPVCHPDPLGDGRPVIFACLHRDIIPAILYVRPAHPSLLVSNSPDGEILIRSLGRASYGFVRGAAGEEGSRRAFLGMLRELRDGRSVGVAVDGPRGPFGTIRDGVLQLARRSGAAILPLVAGPRRALALKTWDRTVVPLPLSRVEVLVGEPLALARQATAHDVAALRQALHDFFLPPVSAKG